MNKKRGQGLPISTIILLILGIVILVFLIIGFTQGWSKFSSFFNKNNVQEVVTNCDVACSTDSQYDYCFTKRSLNSETEKLKEVTCYYLFMNNPAYGIAGCSSIRCEDSLVLILDLASGEPLNNRCVGNEGKTIQALVNSVLQSEECPVLNPIVPETNP